MASILRQIVAGPRSRHPEAGLDLCYVTDQIIATSGPSGTYPQRAYRNPLDQLVKFLDYKHGEDWAIWEFRAEGTGYPDEEVYGRINHYPWPDHHPPPFRLVPMIMAGMRNWLREKPKPGEQTGQERQGRVVVVHCKAGKGRSGTVACSYLISECGWKPSEALARFTERRMRPGFGQGVSIPSQLRWVGYVDRWTKSGKLYVERQIEIMEVHVWGLRDGVRVQVEGYVDEGKTIKLFHMFTKGERVVVDGAAPGGGGFTDMISDMAGFQNNGKIPVSNGTNTFDGAGESKARPTTISGSSSTVPETTETEPGGGAVIFKPSSRVILPTSDVNIDFERRNKASIGWAMVTAVAHVWFNTYFEGNGPEQSGTPDANGIFEIEWDKMDGIKGSSRKGTRAFDRMAVIWKAHDAEPGEDKYEAVIHEPGTDSPVPQMAAADWKGGHPTSPSMGKDLGLRNESAASANVSKASSVKSSVDKDREDLAPLEGVKSSGPAGNEDLGIDLNDLPSTIVNSPSADLTGNNAGLNTETATIREHSSGVLDPGTRAVMDSEMEARVTGVSSISTKDLPNGKLEDELKDAKDHHIGHLSLAKKTIDS